VNQSWTEYKEAAKVPLYFEELNVASNWEVMLHLFNKGKQGARQLGQIEKTANKEFKGMFKELYLPTHACHITFIHSFHLYPEVVCSPTGIIPNP
jgi:hypothetical protein